MLDPSILVGSNHPPASGGLGAASLVELQAAQQQTQQMQQRAKMLAAALEFQSKLDSCRDFGAAATLAVRLLCEALPAERVQIAWRTKPELPCEMVADSDLSQVAENAKAVAAAEEIAARGSIAVLPCNDDLNRHSLLAVKQYFDATDADSLIALPLSDEEGKPLGAMLAFDVPPQDPALPGCVHFLNALCPALSGKLVCFQSIEPRKWERMIRAVTLPSGQQRRRVLAAVVVVFCAIMLMPVRYNVPATCELQPVRRRFVAAPFDGPLEKVLVRPGDVVREGDTLARINPREIEYQLAGLRADFRRAEQERLGLVAEHDFAGGKIAALEAESFALEANLLEYQRDNLEIRSPLSGVVVTGDLETSEGTPLTKGDTLFEIAPLGKMIVEVAISEQDLAYVRTGMDVEFYLHAIPERMMSGKLQRVHPKAELRNHDNVFIGEVYVDDPDGVLRPGMRGRSWVRSDRHPLGWNLFHKAYFAVRNGIGW